MEEQGFKFTEKEGQLNLIKYGIVQSNIDEAIIKNKIQNYKDPIDRIRQLKAIFHKYKTGLELEKFMETMNRKFGLKLILHQHTGHSTPYGYTIIDYKKKQVLKGSQIMPLRQLLMPIVEEERKQMLDGLLGKIEYSKTSFQKMKMELSKYGFEVSNGGAIKLESDHKILGAIEPLKLQLLKYNGRIALANQFNIESEAEKAVLAKLFHIKIEDLSISQKPNKEAISYYSGILQNLDQKYGANELLELKKLEILGFQNKYYLLDSVNKHLFDISRLNPDHTLDFNYIDVRHLDKTAIQEVNHRQHTSNPIGQLAQLFDLSFNESNDHGKRKKKKGKQRQL